MTDNTMLHINKLINKLEIVSINQQLPRSFAIKNIITLNDKEIKSLAGYSSILSLSDITNDISLSYEIITRLLELTNGECRRVVAVADVVLSRIGNFPGRKLLHTRHANSDEIILSPSLRLECIARESENTFFTGEKDDGIILTDFQYKLLDSLEHESALSVSAPTSAGKSFILNLDLIRQIRSKTGESIVYIVPTRALISEVSSRIRATLRNELLDDVIVRTAPFPVSRDKIKLAVIYVFTQERMMSFINSQESKPYVSSLIIDEAHEIQNGKRGIVLQNAIETTLSRFDSIKLLFASPLIKNPAYLLSLFNQSVNGKYFVENVSPVSQNLILVSEVNRKPKQLNISLLSHDKIVEIGDVDINFRFRDGIAVQRANLAVQISSSNESVLSFSNGPSSAENVAFEVSKLITDFTPNVEILNFVDFVKREVHSDYPLINCVLKGVAFHYGNMPSLVRMGVENLFKEGHLKIICCTSTLLQGVNLPAKHIIIENPKSGDNPMTRANFLNLAGRAGRLLKEFHGNIWCVRPGGWESECYKGDQLQEICSAMSQVMDDGGTSIQKLLNNLDLDNSKPDDAEAAFGKLYHDYLLDPSHEFIEQYRNEINTDVLDITLSLVKEIEVTLPIEILENNQSLRPDHLEALYIYLNKTEDLSKIIPLSPHVTGGKARMEDIFLIITTCFEWNATERYMSWVSWLAYQWLKGDSIHKILTGRVNNLRYRNSDKSTSTIIRECLKVIENSIRFKLVKYFSAYIEVLRYVVLRKGLDQIFDEIEPYHIYLEFGSCDRNALNLMALGLSRFTALHLKDMFDFSDDVEAEEYLEQLKVMNVNSFKMPELCLREVKDLIGLK